MQKENTPRPSTWWANVYDAAGNPCGRVLQRYWTWSTSTWGCSTRTPTANGFASSARPRRRRSANTSRAECPVARITPRPATTSSAAVCSALEHDRPKTALDQRERREQPGRTRPDDHDRRCTAHVTESQRGRCLGAKRLIDPDPDAEQPHGTSLPRIERPPDDHVVR